MSSPLHFCFREVREYTRVLIIALSIFLISLAVGMLIFGINEDPTTMLSTDSLHHSSEMINLTP